MRYCFDLIIYWFYAIAIIALCWLGSGDVMHQAVLYVPIMLLLTVPVLVKLLNENKKRKKLLGFSPNGMRDAKMPQNAEK